jgi:hypothetical protein
MITSIPSFDHNLVLPPHRGDPRVPSDLSPYPCTTLELCQRLGYTPERRMILSKFLDFRERLQDEGLIEGFQWVDGSFLEDVETRENRPPNDIDVVTVYWGYDLEFQLQLLTNFPEVADPALAKDRFHVDHYPFDAGEEPTVTLEFTRYWILLFSHNRLGVWKGMLQIPLNTPTEDAAARELLNTLSL